MTDAPMQKENQNLNSGDKKHRSHLPILSPERTGLITYDAKDPDTKFPPIEQLRPPNVLLILIDDAEFGSASAFSGPCGNAFSGTVKGVQLAIGDAAERSDPLVS